MQLVVTTKNTPACPKPELVMFMLSLAAPVMVADDLLNLSWSFQALTMKKGFPMSNLNLSCTVFSFFRSLYACMHQKGYSIHLSLQPFTEVKNHSLRKKNLRSAKNISFNSFPSRFCLDSSFFIINKNG